MEQKKQIREQLKYAKDLFQADQVIRQYTGFKTIAEKIAFLKGMFDEALEIKNLENPEEHIDPENELYRNCLSSIMAKDARKEMVSINVKLTVSVEFKRTNRNGTHIFAVYVDELDRGQVGEIRLFSDDSIRFVKKNDEWPWEVHVRSKYSAVRLKKIISQQSS